MSYGNLSLAELWKQAWIIKCCCPGLKLIMAISWQPPQDAYAMGVHSSHKLMMLLQGVLQLTIHGL